ncbi:MAG: cysteine-rich CWC family protein [Casimicrobium sp.]
MCALATMLSVAANEKSGTAGACGQCGAPFVCGANAANCWCQSLPLLDLSKRSADELAAGCLCPECLSAALNRGAVRIKD